MIERTFLQYKAVLNCKLSVKTLLEYWDLSLRVLCKTCPIDSAAGNVMKYSILFKWVEFFDYYYHMVCISRQHLMLIVIDVYICVCVCMKNGWSFINCLLSKCMDKTIVKLILNSFIIYLSLSHYGLTCHLLLIDQKNYLMCHCKNLCKWTQRLICH